MDFGVAAAGERQIRTRLHVFDEVACVEEFVLRGKIRIDVAAEREDVFNAVRLEFLDLLVNVGMRGVHACKVRDGLGAEILLDVADKFGNTPRIQV